MRRCKSYCGLACVDGIATADVVRVVRCGQCVHFGNFHDCHYHKADENGTPIFVRENDFCSYGERRNDDVAD